MILTTMGGEGGGGEAAHARVHIGVATHPRVASLLRVADGDLIEVEQWGGWLGADSCPPICGLWGNIWRGTGITMRVASPFASLNKGTAIVEMILALGVKSPSALPALTSSLGLSHSVRRLRATHPSSSAAYALAAAVLSRHPCQGTSEAGRFDATVDKWLEFTRRAPPKELVGEFLALLSREGGGGGGGGGSEGGGSEGGGSEGGGKESSGRRPKLTLSDEERYALYWLWGACGIGPLKWDMLLTSLACMLGHRTVVLAASSNDNGLLHQEFVDFELPRSIELPRGTEPLGWSITPGETTSDRTGGAGGVAAKRQTTRKSTEAEDSSRVVHARAKLCLSPFPWVVTDREGGVEAEQKRRAAIHAHWESSGKFRLPASLPRSATPLLRAAAAASSDSIRCELSFGRDGGEHAEGGVHACSYYFPDADSKRAGAHKDCWAWCKRTLSASNANVSLLHSRAADPSR